MIELGLSTLPWLVGQQTSPRGAFRPVGCKSFGRAYAPALAFDQQPLEATATHRCCERHAYRTRAAMRLAHVARNAFGLVLR
jgi:hypothetical protein